MATPLPLSQSMRDFIEVVRDYTRDYPELNRLVKGQESSDRQIAWATLDAISYFNGRPPFIGTLTLDDLLYRNQQSLLLRLVVCNLIESVGLLQTRNHVNYSNGGISLGVNDKTPILMKWLQLYKSTAEQLLLQVKVAMNIEGIIGGQGLPSELMAINVSYVGFI